MILSIYTYKTIIPSKTYQFSHTLKRGRNHQLKNGHSQKTTRKQIG